MKTANDRRTGVERGARNSVVPTDFDERMRKLMVSTCDNHCFDHDRCSRSTTLAWDSPDQSD